MHKVYNNNLKKNNVTINSGEFYISNSGEVITTILGSCIAVCLYDQEAGIGGMNHFMLPQKSIYIPETDEHLKYGDKSIDHLLSEMLKAGAKLENIKAKIFGGGNVVAAYNLSEKTIGSMNIAFTKGHLKNCGIKIVNQDVGNNSGRTISFNTKTSEVMVKKVAITPAV